MMIGIFRSIIITSMILVDFLQQTAGTFLIACPGPDPGRSRNYYISHGAPELGNRRSPVWIVEASLVLCVWPLHHPL